MYVRRINIKRSGMMIKNEKNKPLKLLVWLCFKVLYYFNSSRAEQNSELQCKEFLNVRVYIGNLWDLFLGCCCTFSFLMKFHIKTTTSGYQIESISFRYRLGNNVPFYKENHTISLRLHCREMRIFCELENCFIIELILFIHLGSRNFFESEILPNQNSTITSFLMFKLKRNLVERSFITKIFK